jgi:hypothetical protein
MLPAGEDKMVPVMLILCGVILLVVFAVSRGRKS